MSEDKEQSLIFNNFSKRLTELKELLGGKADTDIVYEDFAIKHQQIKGVLREFIELMMSYIFSTSITPMNYKEKANELLKRLSGATDKPEIPEDLIKRIRSKKIYPMKKPETCQVCGGELEKSSSGFHFCPNSSQHGMLETLHTEMCRNWNYVDKSCVSDGKFNFPYEVVVEKEDLQWLFAWCVTMRKQDWMKFDALREKYLSDKEEHDE